VRRLALTGMAILLGAYPASAQEDGGGMQEFDACGVLLAGAGCALFEGGGGTYVVVNTGDFQFGDTVRVVGTLDPDCITICPEADGCIRGAELYDPAVFPCGTSLPSFPEDIITGVCSTVSTGLLTLTLAGTWLTRRRAGRGQALRRGPPAPDAAG